MRTCKAPKNKNRLGGDKKRYNMNELSLFNSIFNDVFDTPAMCRTTTVAPRVDIEENENSYTLEMELPGRTEKDVNIELDQDNLTIASSKTEQKEEKEEKKAGKYILKERRTSSFERRFVLPKDVDTENISADFKNGILTVYLQKKASELPKKIEIKALTA